MNYSLWTPHKKDGKSNECMGPNPDMYNTGDKCDDEYLCEIQGTSSCVNSAYQQNAKLF